MYDEIKRHYDNAAAKGDAVRELVWLGKHTDAVDEGGGPLRGRPVCGRGGARALPP